MDRRSFIKSLVAAATITSLPAGVIARPEWETTGLIHGETFVLDETLKLYMPDGFRIVDCIFKTSKLFTGGPIVELLEGEAGFINRCTFIGDLSEPADCAIKISTPTSIGLSHDFQMRALDTQKETT